MQEIGTQEWRESLRRTVRYFYDLQKTRIGFGNRSQNPEGYVEKLNEKTGKTEKRRKRPTKAKMDEALLEIASALKDSENAKEYKELDDKVPVTLEEQDRKFLSGQALALQGLEESTLRRIKEMLTRDPIYEGFLKNVKGCGPTLSGVIRAEICMMRPVNEEFIKIAKRGDNYNVKGHTYFNLTFIETKKLKDDTTKEIPREIACFERNGVIYQDCCPTVSSLWAYCGLAVDTETGKAVRRKKGVQANWHPFLKTKLLGVLSGTMLKSKSDYTVHYYNRKNRQKSAEWGSSDAHRHNDAMRIMIKEFLKDLWKFWREQEGMPCPDPYAEAMLGRKHGDHGGRPNTNEAKKNKAPEPSAQLPGA